MAEVRKRALDVQVVTTHHKDRPDVKQTEVLHGKRGELRLGIHSDVV